MQTRQKIKAFSALALAAGAIGGGALISQQAMAASSAPPAGTATMGIVGPAPDGNGLISCTFTDVKLPDHVLTAVPVGEGGPGLSSVSVHASGGLNADGSTTPLPALSSIGAPGESGTVVAAASGDTGTQLHADGTPPAGAPAGSVIVSAVGSGTDAGPGGSLPTLVLPANARQGTTDECDALKAKMLP